MTVRLGTPRIRVVVSADADEAVIVQTIGADMVAAESVARKHKWGPVSDSPVTYLTFLAWSALRRDHRLDEAVTFDQFAKTIGSIEDAPEQEGEDTDAGTPTPPGPGTG